MNLFSKYKVFIIIALILLFVGLKSIGQKLPIDRYFGNYISFSSKDIINHEITLGIYQSWCLYLNQNEVKRNKESYQSNDFISISDYSGTPVIHSDTIFLYQSGNFNALMVLKIIDSLRCKVVNSAISHFITDTLYRISASITIQEKNQTIWIYSMNIPNDPSFLSFESSIFEKVLPPLQPTWYFFNKDETYLRKTKDSVQVHPLTKKFINFIKW